MLVFSLCLISYVCHHYNDFQCCIAKITKIIIVLVETYLAIQIVCLFTSCPFLKTAGGIVLGSVAVSAVSAVSVDVLPYISVAIKASFLKLGMCNICKNNIDKMFLDF